MKHLKDVFSLKQMKIFRLKCLNNLVPKGTKFFCVSMKL